MKEVYRTLLQEKAIQYLNREEKWPRSKIRNLIIDKDIFTGEFVIYDMG